ncbi:hypothetical protein AB0E55_23585 [Amycolatopsis keratiniphila]|uniref:Uncharacterized protein n=1 Tax=Amycolatopsis keratiniphila TaxID=129921 RepID=R4SRC3_9PSEU|nr:MULTISPECIES: hypothetical protein [Amycolatopsis]AGM05165.1 hypothetical protein AORI_2577 [Amycolatopsis keratiniphila]OLZ48818.1 hypothetical protein BS330_33705 [Amycolatopsis keratiniphila subsp. nogabecina]RSN35248.1 hypothetical protein DMC61_07540 [Amycolatopsis sp. WAC 04169]SDU33862.1 hypothetical protein SAMN04489733_3188 [Amycolatopsis keratiniphila]
MIELLGIILLVQGGGGLINRLLGSTNPSWFVQLHLLPPGMHVVASALMVAAGVGVLFAERARKQRRRSE